MRTEPAADRLQSDIVDLLPALRAFSRRFYSHTSDAEDLVQETVTKALSNLEKFQDGTRLKSWLFTIMRNSFCSRFATRKREAPGQEDCVADLRSTEPSQDWSMLVKDVEQRCQEMPVYYRAVLERIVIEGQSYEDAASELGCAVGTVKSRLNRARSHLIARFGSLDD